jgi:hypothetical protein
MMISHHILGIKEDKLMIQSIQAGNTALYNPTQNAMVTGKVTINVTANDSLATQDEDENTTTSSQGDTLTISSAGVQAAKVLSAESANRASNGLSDDGYTDANASALSSAASGIGITEYTAIKNENSTDSAAVSGSSSSSSSSSSNLSQYTETELKEMLENGDITQAEYNAEIKSREESDTTSDEESDNAVIANTSETEA